jgi:hypothetical protein
MVEECGATALLQVRGTAASRAGIDPLGTSRFTRMFIAGPLV